MNGTQERKGHTLEQQRAAFALEKIQQLSKQKEIAKEAAMYIRKLPTMTFANGLGQALAFMLAKAGNKKDHPAHQVYDILADWLIKERKIYRENIDLLENMMTNERGKYIVAQEEIWALLDWLKKFADAILPAEESEWWPGKERDEG